MKIFNVAIISLALILTIYSCSPVRSTTFTKSSKSKPIELESGDLESAQKQTVKQDTTVIELPPVKVTGMMSQSKRVTNIETEFSGNIKLFDDKKYDEACKKFIQFRETLEPTDSLYFEAMFYISECHVVKSEFQQAERVLLGLYNSGFIPQSIFEKTLIRLGHVNCALNKEQKANIFFRELADLYPNSIYLPLADCKYVKGR